MGAPSSPGPLFFPLGWDRTNLHLAVILSEAFFSGVEGPASVFRHPIPPQKNGCPTLAGLLFFPLGWDRTKLYSAVILSDRSAAKEVEGPASVFRHPIPPQKNGCPILAGLLFFRLGWDRTNLHSAVILSDRSAARKSKDLLLSFATPPAIEESLPHPSLFPAKGGIARTQTDRSCIRARLVGRGFSPDCRNPPTHFRETQYAAKPRSNPAQRRTHLPLARRTPPTRSTLLRPLPVACPINVSSVLNGTDNYR